MSTRFHLSLIIIFLLKVSTASAEPLIIDTEQRLRRLARPGNSVHLGDHFQCHQKKDFFMRTGLCSLIVNGDMLKTSCTSETVLTAVLQSEDCNNESVQIYSSLGQSWAVTADDFKASYQTVIHSLFKNIHYFYEPVDRIEIVNISYPFGRKLIESGKMREIFPSSVLVDVFPLKDSDVSIQLVIELDLRQTGLNQLMYFGEGSYGDDYVLKRKGYINGH